MDTCFGPSLGADNKYFISFPLPLKGQRPIDCVVYPSSVAHACLKVLNTSIMLHRDCLRHPALLYGSKHSQVQYLIDIVSVLIDCGCFLDHKEKLRYRLPEKREATRLGTVLSQTGV